MLSLSDKSTVFILAPANSASGGQEALHQLGYYLNKSGYSAKIAYYFFDSSNGSPVVEKYEMYSVPFCFYDDIEDKSDNILICPEIATGFLHNFKHIQKAIWWLSVHFYTGKFRHSSLFYTVRDIIRGKPKEALRRREERKILFNFDDDSVVHYTGSQYAYNYVKSRGANPHRLIEPLGLDFLNGVLREHRGNFDGENRKQVILYNPARKSRKMDLLQKNHPDFKYVPLQNMTPFKLIQTMKESALYVDFGKFPGPERLPKEAVICGCCIITGTRGASAYYEDVRVPDAYKMRNQSINEIAELISDVLENYHEHIGNFQAYRDMVLNLENNFLKMITENFVVENSTD